MGDEAVNTDELQIDEVRGIRREFCAQFGSDLGRQLEHVNGVERDYAERRKGFAWVRKEAAAKAVEWRAKEAFRTDEPLADEDREIRSKLAEWG